MTARFAIEYAAKKSFYFFARPIRKLYRFFVRPTVRGVKIAVMRDDMVLLVRPNYAHRLWTLPGGAVDRGETYEDAGRREVMEETGLSVDSLTFIREYESVADFARSVNKVFAATAHSAEFSVDGIEIAEAGWFPLTSLPENRVHRVDETLRAYTATKM